MRELWELIGISPVGALAVVIGTCVLYSTFLLITRVLGQRVLASLSGFDLAVVIVLGAIIGRATLGPLPTFSGGLVALITLLAMEGLVGYLRHRPGWARLVTNDAVLLMAGTTILQDHLARYHVTEGELRSRLRQAGIRNDGEVAAVILETTGTVSVMRRGALVAPAMLRGVRGAERMPAELVAG